MTNDRDQWRSCRTVRFRSVEFYNYSYKYLEIYKASVCFGSSFSLFLGKNRLDLFWII